MLALNLASTLFLCGLIWFVQVVHYPLFGLVGVEAFGRYAGAHQSRTSLVVIVPMLAELVSAVWLCFGSPQPLLTGAALALVGVIWISTFLLQVPQHDVLARAFDGRAHTRLVRTNWIRTVAWSIRAVLMLRFAHLI